MKEADNLDGQCGEDTQEMYGVFRGPCQPPWGTFLNSAPLPPVSSPTSLIQSTK